VTNILVYHTLTKRDDSREDDSLHYNI